MLEDKILSVKKRIEEAARRSGRSPEDVKLVAVSKTFSESEISNALDLGIDNFGENYIPEAVEKIDALNEKRIQWHFVGHLQSNKVKTFVGKFSLLHSLDSMSVITELEKRIPVGGFQRVLLQVQFVPEDSKSGVAPDEVPVFLQAIQASTKIRLEGLMVMPPIKMPTAEKRKLFRKVKEKQSEWKRLVDFPQKLDVLSMGTTHDFELAIEEGSTMVRIGSAIFGERKTQ